MSAYLDAMDVRLARTRQVFVLFNERRYDELLTHFTDDVVSFIPDLAPDLDPDLRYAKGKVQYLVHLQSVRDRYGALNVTSVFAVGACTDIQVVDAAGNIGSFAAHLTDDGLVSRIFFLHNARGSRANPDGDAPEPLPGSAP
jgi:hypothetical protein